MIPLNNMTQEMMDIASNFSFSAFILIKSRPINIESITHTRKMITLKIVVIRRIRILMSSVVKEVNNAKFLYNINIDKSKHIAIDKMDTISFLIVRARINDKKESVMMIPLFLYASLMIFSFLFFSASRWFNLSSSLDNDSSFKLISFRSNN